MGQKTIVITGITRGLGRVMMEEFQRLGHVVIGCGRDKSAIDELKNKFAQNTFLSSVDISDSNSVEMWAKEGMKKFGTPDLLLNNAAIMNRVSPLWEQTENEFSKIIDINIKGVMNIIQAFVPSMVKQKSGVICNFSSGWGRSTSSGVAPYCGTKYAIEGLSLAMAQELPDGMASIPLNPGIINTDMLQSCWADGAGQFPTADVWAKKAIPFILSLNENDNGKSLSVPQ